MAHNIGGQPFGTTEDSSGGGISTITSSDGSITIGNPTGPTVDLTQPAPAPWVMSFAGSNDGAGFPGPHVNAGYFWRTVAGLSLGNCWWQGLVKPAITGQYWMQGAGARHAILMGSVRSVGPGPLPRNITGSVRDVAGQVAYATQTCDAIQDDEWVHVQIGVDVSGNGNAILVFLDGMLAAHVPITTRYAPVAGSGQDTLYFGGSTHQQFRGLAAWWQGWDADQYPHNYPTGGWALPLCMRPEITRFDSPTLAPDVTLDMTIPGSIVPDRATNQLPPLTGYRYRDAPLHHGYPGCINIVNGFEFSNQTPNELAPVWVRDPTCFMYTIAPRTIVNAYTKAAEPVPVDQVYRLWDSFGNRLQTPAVTEPQSCSLGSTEAGTLAPQAWTIRAAGAPHVDDYYNFGVFAGNAVNLGRGGAGWTTFPAMGPYVYASAVARLDSGVSNGGVNCDFPTGSLAQLTATFAFPVGPVLVCRCSDQDNYFWFSAHQNFYTFGKMVAGVPTILIGPTPFPVPFTSLQIIYDGADLFTIYYGTGNRAGRVWTALGTVTDAFNHAATGVGITSEAGSMARFQNFGAF